MTATFDGYFYIAENGAESDDGRFWFEPERVSGRATPMRGMPSPVQLIGGPLDGQTIKRACNVDDHSDIAEAIMRDQWFKVRHDLDFDRSPAGQELLAMHLADLVVKGMEPHVDCVSFPCALFFTRRAVKSFVAEYYGAD